MASDCAVGRRPAVPSSMIFASLVVLWLLILVPAVARHRQEVARPSVAALSGRVLARSPRRRSQEVNRMDERYGTGADDGQMVATCPPEVHVPSARTELSFDDDAKPAIEDVAADVDDWADTDERLWERPPARYRAGRGGFDAEAAALAARTRYAFRQRVVLAMLVTAIATGVAAAVALQGLWWGHAAVDILLVGYLVYLRRQVRLEEAIRARRAARMAGTRRPPAADDPELDEWAERGRTATLPVENDEAARRGDDEAEAPLPRPRPPKPSTSRPRRRGLIRGGPGRRGGAARPSAPAPDARRPRSRRARRWSRTRTTNWTSTTAPLPATAVRSASRRLLRFGGPRRGHRGCGAVGSATRSHRVGQGFDSPQLHLKIINGGVHLGGAAVGVWSGMVAARSTYPGFDHRKRLARGDHGGPR